MFRNSTFLVRFGLVCSIFISGCASTTALIQNDIVSRTDNNFTNGFELRYQPKPENAPRILQSVTSKLPQFRLLGTDPTETTRIKASLRQDIYTPTDISKSELITDENPYTGTLTGNVSRISATDKQRLETELQVGVSGHASLADSTQKWVHDNLPGNQHPNGWRHQVPTEPLLNLNVSRTIQDDRIGYCNFEIVPQTTAQLRLGNINADLLLQRGLRYGYNVPYLNRSNSDIVSVYGFTDGFTLFRERSIYFDGGVFRDAVQTVDSKFLVLGFLTGVATEYKGYSLRYLYNIRTQDYEEQKDKFHGFGMVQFGVDF